MRSYVRWEQRIFQISLGITVLSLVCFLIFFTAYQFLSTKPYLFDYFAYYDGANSIIHGNALYPPPGSDYPLNTFTYPPLAALLFVPFTIFPRTLSGVVFVSVSVLTLVAAIWYLLSQVEVRYQANTPTSHRLLIIVMMLGFSPTLLWIRNGQVTGIATAILCYAMGVFLRSDDERSGWWLAIFPMFKPYYTPILAPGLRSKRRLLRMVGFGAALVGLSVLFFGVETHRRYIALLSSSGQFRAGQGIESWWAATYRPFFWAGGFERVVQVTVLLLVVVSIIWTIRTEYTTDVWAVAAGIIGLFMTGIGVSALTFSLFIPVAIVLYFDGKLSGRYGDRLLVLVSVLLLHAHFPVMRFLVGEGPRYLPQTLLIFEPLFPFLRPGAWGALTLLFALVNWGFKRDTEDRGWQRGL